MVHTIFFYCYKRNFAVDRNHKNVNITILTIPTYSIIVYLYTHIIRVIYYIKIIYTHKNVNNMYKYIVINLKRKKLNNMMSTFMANSYYQIYIYITFVHRSCKNTIS